MSPPPLPAPITARIASIVAALFAALAALTVVFGNLFALPQFLLFLIGALGIRKQRKWSGYGLALVLTAQAAVILLSLSRAAGDTPGAGTLLALLLQILAIALFAAAGRALEKTGAPPGRAAGWVVVAAVSFIPFIFVQPFSIPTGAMEDTLLIGDHILVRRFPHVTPSRGDIVVIRYPIDPRQSFVKRVIGMPGDHLKIVNKQVIVNGAPLREPYAIHKTDYVDPYRDNFPSQPNVRLFPRAGAMLAEDVLDGELVVPDGRYFVLGDNRDSSLDSRYWGFVTADDIIGKPWIVYYSVETPPGAASPRNPTIADVRWRRTFHPI